MAGLSELLLTSLNPFSVLGFFLFLLILYFISTKSNENEPPGPRPIPLVGNLLQLDLKNLQNALWELSRKYGSVFTVWMGTRRVVVLAGYKTVKEALVTHGDAFGERDPPLVTQQTLKGHGLVFSNGEIWREMRRFALTNLRDFGMGRKASEDKIIEECGHLLDVLRKFNGKPFETMQPLNYAVSNIICSLLYGQRFQYDDHKFTTLVKHVNLRIQLGGSPSVQLYNMIPWTGRWLKDTQRILKVIRFLMDETFTYINHMRETLSPQTCRGIVDSFLVKQQSLQESGQTDTVYNDDNLASSVVSLFGAGTETTATTLRWGLLIMAKHQHIQDQVREEILRVIGTRQVQTEDRRDLPFTDAVIHETQRFANIAPMSIPHRTTQDITFQGHFIRKGTKVIPLLTSVLYDESQWEKPHSFYPEHFLDKDGKFMKRDAFMPFSAGRRACLGEGLARMELFIFFVTLMQHFRFTAPPGVRDDQLDLTPITGQTLSPKPHQLCAEALT